jgi:hypothetical protein
MSYPPTWCRIMGKALPDLIEDCTEAAATRGESFEVIMGCFPLAKEQGPPYCITCCFYKEVQP